VVSQIFELGRDENEINNTNFDVNRYRCTSTGTSGTKFVSRVRRGVTLCVKETRAGV
jgi:hypothetical protein